MESASHVGPRRLYWPARTVPRIATILLAGGALVKVSLDGKEADVPDEALFSIPDGCEAHRLSTRTGTA